MKWCSICGFKIDKFNPYLYMDATGESTISNISILGSNLILCPKCTHKLSTFLKDLISENKQKNINILKKHKIVNIN